MTLQAWTLRTVPRPTPRPVWFAVGESRECDQCHCTIAKHQPACDTPSGKVVCAVCARGKGGKG